MSLSIITASSNGIVAAADRRVGSYIHPVLVDAQKFAVCPSGLIFFDGNKKLTICDSPHNFVAFTYTGSGSIDSHKLIENFKSTLPAHRLKIKEYADELSKFYSKDSNRYRFGQDPFDHNDSNNIFITGYNINSSNAFLYQLDLPHRPKPIPLIEHIGGIVVSGVGDHFEEAVNVFKEKQIANIRNRINGNQMLGKPSNVEEAKLKLIKSSDIPWSGMLLEEMQSFAEFAIGFEVAGRTRLNQQPVVGGGMDVVKITRQRGVEIIKYEPYLEVGKRPLAETHLNHIVLNCCENNTKVQIDFELDNPLGEQYIRYPADEKFQCAKCNTVHDLKELREIIQQIVGFYVIVDNKIPT